MNIENLIEQDGELSQTFLDSQRSAVDMSQVVLGLEKEREREMLLLMTGLERKNKQLQPKLFVTFGKGEKRTVVCRISNVHIEKFKGNNNVQFRDEYIAFTKKGFYVFSQSRMVEAYRLDEHKDRYQNPFKKLDGNHDSLRGSIESRRAHLSWKGGIPSLLGRGVGQIYYGSEISGEEALEKFEVIIEKVSHYSQARIEKEQGNLRVAGEIRDQIIGDPAKGGLRELLGK